MCLIGCPEVSRRAVVAGLAAVPAAACARPMPRGISQRTIRFTGDGADVDAFVALPRRPASHILAVLHGNAGIPDDVRDTAVWAAGLGYGAIAVNPTARFPDPTKIPRSLLLGTEFGETYFHDVRAGVAKLRADQLAGDGKLGVFGYCGGGYVGLMWAASRFGRELGAIVGAHVATQHLRGSEDVNHRPPGLDYFRRASVPVQLHQGGSDQYTPPQDIAEVRRVGTELGKTLEVFVYPRADHGFAMHTDPTYRPADAKLVKARAAVFLKRHLG